MMKYLLFIIITFYQYTSIAQRYAAELILQKTNIVVKKDKLIKNQYFEIKINNRSGEKYSKISIPFSKLNKMSNLKAFVKDAKGKIVKKLKKSEIIKRSSISDFSFYEDEFVKEFTLRHNSYPYTLIYSYQISSKEFLYIDYWIPVISERIPTYDAKLDITVPKDYKISYKCNFVDKPIRKKSKKNIIFHWQTKYLDVLQSEKSSPPLIDIIPSVAVIPKEFNFEIKGSFKNWKTFGFWQYNLLSDINKLPDFEKDKVKMIIDGIKDDKKKIKALYHYLQDETRYLNITIETGGLKPYPAEYVAVNKYGDCKALTNYFKSILDFVKIKSYYTNVYAGNTIKKIIKDFPSQQFNHVILYVPLKDEELWLDCTSNGAFNYLGTFTQNRDAFIIDKKKSYYVKTPALDTLDVLEMRKVKINLSSSSKYAIAFFKNSYKGKLYEQILQINENFNGDTKKNIVRKYYVEDGFDLIDYNIFTQNRDSTQIEFVYKARSENIYKYYGSDLLLSNIPFTLPQYEKPKDRKLPIQIDYPTYKIDTIIYEIPEGFELNNNISNQYISNRFGNYNFKVYKEKNNIVVSKKLLINSGYYPVSDYEEFYSFYEQIVKSENKLWLSLFQKHK
jgi:hypothetical protein